MERATGTPYRIFLADRVFGPLGLTRTFAGAPHGRPDLAQGHDDAGGPLPSWELDVVGMGAGFTAFAGDILERGRRIVVLTNTDVRDPGFLTPLLA
ncbi:hypothetical protein GCM10020358_70190 [Amorphoplanes nipponensis]|uniref:Uncharacterized protein n=1 Tax=Actinoplanes nipponensis TaxID=135950 RepID=A0A919JQL6_9ACTN|nr:beta-lactamase family protein [Actinoplanes nipponensis]GIE51144.1 hypothetical protein Ani05nite_46780 [Actinoplanes nipponensis]